MSPVSRKRAKKAGTSRKPSGRPQRTRFDAIYRLLAEALRPTLGKVDPLEAELVVSDFLGSMRGADPANPAVSTDTLDGLIKNLASRTTPEATAALVALAILAPAQPSRALARAGLRAGSGVLPAWAEAIGSWRLGRVMLLTDAFGDQAHVLLEFAGAGARHTLVALVDFSHLGGWCPDLMITADPDAMHGAMAQDAAASEGLARFAALDPAAACFLLVRALTATDTTLEPDVTASFGDTIALALARLRLVSVSVGARADDAAAVGEALGSAGLAVPFDLDHPPTADPAERDRIVERFLASAPVAALIGVEPDSVEYLARLLVDYGFDFDNGRPLRVSPTKLGNFLLRWLPRKATLDADDRAAVPAVIAAWVEFAVGLSPLPLAAVGNLHAQLAGLLTDFATEYDNPENFGPARALLEGIDDVSSVEELQEMVSERVTEQDAELTPGWTYTVRADVAYSSPPIWRRLTLPGETTLGQLHDVLQSSFGWDSGHLHVFTVRGTHYGSFDVDFDDGSEDEDSVTLRQLVARTGQKFTYLYDFGDSWEVQLKVEKIDRTGSRPIAVCTGGRRGGPFEDSGGVGGYENMCAVLADPDHAEHAQVAEWLGFEPGAVTFDPAAFDESALNRVLAELALD